MTRHVRDTSVTVMQREGQAVRVLTRRRAVHDISPLAASKGVAGVAPMQARRITVGTALRAARRSRAAVAHIQYQTGAYDMRPTVNLLPAVLRARWGRPVVVTFHDLLVPIFRNGRCIYDRPSLNAIRARAAQELSRLPAPHQRFENPHEYRVGLEPRLHDLKTRLIRQARGLET